MEDRVSGDRSARAFCLSSSRRSCSAISTRGRNQEHRPGLALVEPVDGQHQVQHFVPGHVDHVQRHATLHGLAGDQVQAREVRDQLQDTAYLDVLEIHAHPLPGVGNRLFATGSVSPLVRRLR